MNYCSSLLNYLCQILKYAFSKNFTNSNHCSYEELEEAIKYVFRIKNSNLKNNENICYTIQEILISDEFKEKFLDGIRVMSNEFKFDTLEENGFNKIIKSYAYIQKPLNLYVALNESRIKYIKKNQPNKKIFVDNLFPLKIIPNSKINEIQHKLNNAFNIDSIKQIIDGSQRCFYIFLKNREVKVVDKTKMKVIEEFFNINFLKTINENKAVIMVDETFTQFIIRTDYKMTVHNISVPQFDILSICSSIYKEREYILILTNKKDILSFELRNENSQIKLISVYKIYLQCQEYIISISLGEFLAIQFQDVLDLFVFPENIFVFRINLVYRYDGYMKWSSQNKLLVSGEMPFVFHINKKSNFTRI